MARTISFSAERPAWPAQVRITSSEHSLSVSDREGTNLRFDGLGRWRSAGLRGALYARALDGRIVLRSRSREPITASAELEPASVARFHEHVREAVVGLLERDASGETRLVGVADREESIALARTTLGRACDWSAQRFAEDAARYAAIYPAGIRLPPDRARDLVLVARESPDAFRAHALGVAEFFGPALESRSGILIVAADDMRAIDLAIAESPEAFARAPGPRDPRDLALVVSPSLLASEIPAGLPVRWREAGVSRLAVEIGDGESMSPRAENLAAFRAAGIGFTVVAIGANAPAVRKSLALLELAREDFVHVAPENRDRFLPDGMAARIVLGAPEDLLYYA